MLSSHFLKLISHLKSVCKSDICLIFPQRRKRKRHDYVDYDKADDQFEYQPKIRRRSPPGPFDSPYHSPEEKGKRSPPGPYDSPYRSPPGPYDSPPDSPPGPYDSPPEDSDDEDR